MKRNFAELNKYPIQKSSKDKSKIKNEDGDLSDEELMPKALPLQNNSNEFDETEDSISAAQYLLGVRQEAGTYDHNSVATNLADVKSAPISHGYAPNSFLFEYFSSGKENKMQFLKEIQPEWKQSITNSFDSLKQVKIILQTDPLKFLEFAAHQNFY